MRELLGSFIRSFHKAIRGEMDAMRKRLGPFEVPLKNARRADASADGDHVYVFDVIAPNDKLALHTECTLRCEGSELVVTVTGLDRGTVTVRSGHRVPLELATYTLVIYPWFLYERLSHALEGLVDGDEAAMTRAFTAFGKIEPVKTPTPTRLPHPGLNESQLRAVGLCCSSNLAFVWGPPGTGKTTTLGHIVTELVAHGHRVLVTSTTNAAVDQALQKLAGLEAARGALDRGDIVRVGHTHGDTFGAALREVVNRVHRDAHERLEELKSRLMAATGRARQCAQFQSKLEDAAEPLQGDLFEESHAVVLGDWELRAVFDEADLPRLRALPPDQLLDAVRCERDRLEGEKAACQAGIRETSQALSDREPEIVRKARVVLATMTNVYISPLLTGERFDVVIVEEAGMAILPTLFYCATLADAKAVMVGDPKQLPPIVQSRAPYVRQVMGRSIFEVTVPRPHASDVVEMLDTQYRMHPAIGDLVSGL
ncbi:MAG: AAA family ATPase, partial [Nitrospiraceae bacterium]|nr:AAA family ATPase [Nitrospiraceae bacterium]